MMERLGLKPGEVIESGMVTRGIERAQKKVEARNFDIRKNLLEYDEVMDKQRKFIYSQRQEVLEFSGLREKIVGMFEEVLEPILEAHAGNKDEPIEYDEIRSWVEHKIGEAVELDGLERVDRSELFDWIVDRMQDVFQKREQHYGEEEWSRVQRLLLLDTIDQKWKDHLHAMEVLKAGIGLRGYAQVDPKNEYKKEGYEKFKLLKESIADQVTNLIFKVELSSRSMIAPPPRMGQQPMASDPVTAQAMLEAAIAAGQAPPEVMDAVAKGAKVSVESRADQERKRREAEQRKSAQRQIAAGVKKVGRNEPCPCGSGIKYKKCCHPAFG
jgi:preprotein translocase subunit SecA